MKSILLGFIILIMSAGVFANDGLGDFPKNNNKFSNKLIKEEMKLNDGKNFVISPMSLNMAISFLSNGAKGSTLDEFATLLQNGSFVPKDLNVFNRMILAQSKTLGVEQYNIANCIWVRGDYNRNFYLVAKNYYNADVKKLNNDSAKDINSWINNKTNGKIPQMVDKIDPNEKACLVNAVYFYSNWINKFPLYSTREDAEWFCEDGTKATCTMMHHQGEYKVFDYKGGEILIKPLKGHAAMYFMLPPKDTKLSDYVAQFDFNEIITNDIYDGENYKVWLPRFSVEYSESMIDTFKNLGLKKAFLPKQADFSNLAKGDFYISDILHKATIGVDEKGCEASAATVIHMAGMAAPVPAKEIYFNRPFAFAVVDELDNLVIFEGCVYKP